MMTMNEHWILPEWPAAKSVRAIQTTRHGGYSVGKYASMNLATHVHDRIDSVQQNRRLLRAYLPSEPIWLEQVHGVTVINAAKPQSNLIADAAFSHQKNVVCVTMTADCLPVLFCNQSGSLVAAAHAGWRGLSNGILEATVSAMQVPVNTIMAWLGPAIGPKAFEVGDDVRQAFVKQQVSAEKAFVAMGGKWLADIYHLARLRLVEMGVTQIYGGEYCTMSDSERFFSYRREPVSGRMASLIWLE